MSQPNKNQAIAAAVDAVTEKPPPYLKLNAVCWEHIYDYLSFKDIIVMGEKCKRMNRMSGCYIRDYYPLLDFKLIGGEVCFENDCIQPEFYEFVGHIIVNDCSDSDFFFDVESSFDSLKSIALKFQDLTGIEDMENVLKHVENVSIADCEIAGNVIEQLAAYCPKLKRFSSNDVMSTNAVFFKQYYPALEGLVYRRSPQNNSQTGEIKIFLEKHSNLKRFEIDFEFLLANRIVLMETNIELNLLVVAFDSDFTITAFDDVVNVLKTLHTRGFYKTLQLSFGYGIGANDVGHFNTAISTLPRLERLLLFTAPFFNLNYLVDLKQMTLAILSTSIDVDAFARSVPNLERLNFMFGRQHSVLPFIRHSKKLKTINIVSMLDTALDIFALNEERKKLNNAGSVLIYLDDKYYLPVQWQSKNLNLDLVKMERSSSFHFLTDL